MEEKEEHWAITTIKESAKLGITTGIVIVSVIITFTALAIGIRIAQHIAQII